MNKKYTILSIAIAIVLIGVVVGATYAFYNYTKTGGTNSVATGSINFSATQGDEVSLNGLFPMDASGTITSETPGVGTLVLHVTGDTSYNEGLEYRVKAVNVTSTTGSSALPISIVIKYEANGNGTTIGTSDNNYFTNRGGSTSIYKVLTTDTISEGQDLVVGYIAPGATGIDGNITIMAYLDASNIAITDTYNGTATATDDMGTTSTWTNSRAVFTTQEWNELSSNGVSFQIKVEANEGTWVTAP